MTANKHARPEVAPPVTDRAAFDAALAEQVAREKEGTRHDDRVSAPRRRLPVAHIMDRTCYGRQQDWEDSPDGWPQYPTYG